MFRHLGVRLALVAVTAASTSACVFGAKLREDAKLEQDGTTVRGDRIDYFIRQEVVRAAAEQGGEKRRVEVVIPPHRLEEE